MKMELKVDSDYEPGRVVDWAFRQVAMATLAFGFVVGIVMEGMCLILHLLGVIRLKSKVGGGEQ